MQTQLVSSHGMLAILEVLEGRCSRDVIMRLLQIINSVRVFLTLNDMTLIHTLDLAAGNRGCGVLGKFLFNWVWDFIIV